MNLNIVLNSTENWGGAGNGNISITNVGTSTLTNWSFQLTTINFTIQTPFWAMNNTGSGNDLTIEPPPWQLTLAPKATISSGFGYSGSSSFGATSSTTGVNVTTSSGSTGGTTGG